MTYLDDEVCPGCGYRIGQTKCARDDNGRYWHTNFNGNGCWLLRNRFIDPRTGLIEGLSTCDNCNKVEHTEAELAACVASMVGPPEKEDDADASGEQWYCYPCNDYFPATTDVCPTCNGQVDDSVGCVRELT